MVIDIEDSIEGFAWRALQEATSKKIKTCDAIDSLYPDFRVPFKIRILNKITDIVLEIKKNN